MIRRTVLLAACTLTMVLAGCFKEVDSYYGFDADSQYENPGVFPGEYRFGNGGSAVLVAGTLKRGDPEVVQLRSALPAYPGPLGGTTEAEVVIPMAIWRPQNATGKVPIIVDAGPYFEIGEHCRVASQDPCLEYVDDTIDWPGQRTPWLLKNFLPHGYAVVQLAVRGTGTAGGCMDLLGPSEVADLDQAITWLGEQPWSNGRIAMIGASYDGSTPWEVASRGNPYLKTIVPVSGLPDIYDLMFHNGSAETRGAIMHNQVYWPFGFDDDFPQWPDEVPRPEPPLPVPVPDVPLPIHGEANGRQDYQDLQNLLCPEVVEGTAVAAGSTTLGTRGGEASSYWVERDHRGAVLANYKGSVFLIHGLQDWNVDPHAAIPFNVQLREAGLEVKEWYGQWGHAYPDSQCGRGIPEWALQACRLDFADVLFRWFERHLKENATIEVGPSVQVQDNLGMWRNLESYPPKADWTELHLTAERQIASKPVVGEAAYTLDPPVTPSTTTVLKLTGEWLQEDLHVSGLPQVRLPFIPKGSGGQLAVWLFDESPNGTVRAPGLRFDPVTMAVTPAGIPVVGHAQMNLLYYAGGEEPNAPTPGQRHVARIEMEPLDIVVPRGHRLVLWVSQVPYPDHQESGTAASVDVVLGGDDAVLRLPVVHPDPRTMFPVPGMPLPERSQLERMHVPMPAAADAPKAPETPAVACSTPLVSLCTVTGGN